ncbi:Nucleotide-binding universal stress protein, UspA family [Formosa sp. Hel1_31_208]|uniref:universal stress protein n=1 Tax=Formosa sp. Hel1_31_208 TaxID=1798225 RepID=UPI0008796B7E|nr:universal stress protein [Formosa sp. Hel1_31_208]SDS17596.1 Nucleotide-binding universal stress protein, UspA family [Formosa sp. Hel1_31_208]
MKNVLLPTDFSENSWNAIEYAIKFFENKTCNFYVLHVNTLDNLIVGDTAYIPTQQEIENIYINPSKLKLRKILKRISDTFKTNKNHKFYTLTDYSFIIESIRKHVDEKRIDIIVMGTKGASGLKEYIIGSNAGDVITKVKCTTLIVPENAKYKQLKELAFPTDFSMSYDIQTLQPISELVQSKHAYLRVLHITKKNAILNMEQESNKEILEDFFDGIDLSFHYLTNNKVEDAIQCFVESRDIDIIVMVAKNLNYFQHILFHSRVEKISYHTLIPFLVLHE